MEFIIFNMWEKILFSMLVSLGFAIIFNTPKRALWLVSFMGGLGFSVKLILSEMISIGDVGASFIGALVVGLTAVYFSHIVHTPPIVFTIPAVINMIPGKYGYSFVIGLLEIVNIKNSSLKLINETLHYGLKALFITLGLSIGILAPMLLFNTYTVKNKDLNKLIKKQVTKVLKK